VSRRVRGQGRQAVRYKLGTDLLVIHSVNVRLKEAMDTVVRDEHGEVEIAPFPNRQLSSGTDMLSQVRFGALELAASPGTIMPAVIKATCVTGAGFACTDYDKVWAAMFKTPGAAAVSLPLREAYQALQTKVADGQENPLALIDHARFYAVQEDCSLSDHAWDGFWFVASGRTWKNMPADVQEIMQKHINAAARRQREDIVRGNADPQKALEEKGLQFNRVEPAPFQALLEANGFYEAAPDKLGSEPWALLQRYTGAND
jgi:TRAP-type C4-dicarboxylate transport system substrate-binding protein